MAEHERAPRDPLTWGVAAVVVLVALAIFGFALSRGSGGSGTSVPARSPDQAVDGVTPPENTQVPRQSQVRIDLATGWEVTRFEIDGTVIPPDQLEGTTQLGQYLFQPGPGQAIELLDAGLICVRVAIERVIDPPDDQLVEWCFNAV